MSEVSNPEFESIFRLNAFFVNAVERLAADIPDEMISQRVGTEGDLGNSPLWILGHLAVCVDFCDSLLGGQVSHPRWVPVFGPGSKGDIKKPERYSREEFLQRISQGYAALREPLASTASDHLDQPHGLEIFANAELKTRRDVVIHLMTTHIAFHSAQMSRCRKACGFDRLM